MPPLIWLENDFFCCCFLRCGGLVVRQPGWDIEDSAQPKKVWEPDASKNVFWETGNERCM